MKKYFRRTWLNIDLDALRSNFANIKAKVTSGAEIMAVVKADAYGHGVEKTVAALWSAGCEWFAVSNLEEAMQVKDAAPDSSVLILGYTPPEHAVSLALNGISQAVFNPEYAAALSAQAADNGVQVRIHIKVDTGMGRLGFTFHDTEADRSCAEKIAEVCCLPGLYPEGIFTHFAVADEEDGEVFTRLQYELFLNVIHLAEELGVKFDLRHCCNSAATILYPEMQLDMVRPGIILYGLSPCPEVSEMVRLSPVMQMETVISMVKELPEGSPVSYGRTYVTGRKTKIATVPVGYADGLRRSLSGEMNMTVNGISAPVIGRICMDQCMLDVTEAGDISEGMTVTVFGKGGLSVDAMAKKCSTISYELLCGINKRVPRVYRENGAVIAISDYMLEQ